MNHLVAENSFEKDPKFSYTRIAEAEAEHVFTTKVDRSGYSP